MQGPRQIILQASTIYTCISSWCSESCIRGTAGLRIRALNSRCGIHRRGPVIPFQPAEDSMASTSAQGAELPAELPNQDLSTIIPRPFDVQEPARTLVELTMIQLAGVIRDKPHWTQKIKDSHIVGKWRDEATRQEADPAALEYAINEQQYWAEQYPDGSLYPAAVPGTFAADDWIPTDLRDKLLAGVAALEAEGEPLWHPGSNNQVRDLVHPSLYPLVYDVTTQIAPGTPGLNLQNCLKATGGGAPITQLPAHVSARSQEVSKKYQWIPAEFDVKSDGKVSILSYINNLHPVTHQSLYPVIASIFERFVPLLSSTLTHSANKRNTVVPVDCYSWYDDQPQHSDFETDSQYDAAYELWEEEREAKQPDVPEFVAPQAPEHVVDLKGRRLQVIVKLASIHLTPDKPRYPGGSWHLEGMENENIVATGIYYFDQENITESRISFRASVDDTSLDYEQNDRDGVEAIYGLEDEGPASQELGGCTTFPGRCLAFPNYLQHRVRPFQLVDATKPGHRKILVFWLVHPATRIMSTERVPPQQLEWLKQDLFQDSGFWPSALPDIPLKIVGAHLDKTSKCPYSLEQAKAYMEKLMDERKYYVNFQNEEMFERPISLCEH